MNAGRTNVNSVKTITGTGDTDESGKSSAMQPGVLYLVATPIGNLGDLSPRAAAVLAEADWIAAEDTRHSIKLLNHLGLKKHLVSYHKHNRRQREPVLLEKLQMGGRLALITDAGMPGISDPGSDLVAACIEAGIRVTVVPGPSAGLAALAVSGLLTDRFAFEGFLPVAGKSRRARLAACIHEQRTLIFYEAPHKLIRTLADLDQSGLGTRRCTIARELTKRHESFYRATVHELWQHFQDEEPRGEIVLVLEGLEAYRQRSVSAGSLPGPMDPISDTDQAGTDLSPDQIMAMNQIAIYSDRCTPATWSDCCEQSASGSDARSPADRLAELMKAGLSVKDAARQCARETGANRNDLYALALQISGRSAKIRQHPPDRDAQLQSPDHDP